MKTTAWYKEFWPWFIWGLLGIFVIICSVMVYIAFKNADEELPHHSQSTMVKTKQTS